MANLYTKNGVPLNVRGNEVFNQSGRSIGRISGSKVFGSNGRYVGTIDGDRLVYRSTDSATTGGSFAPSAGAGTASAPVAGSAIWGEEPDISG
ncbi:hypothetical protein [Nocardiopsis sp. B62]|uniref:hypothetical protein n=1 Tax=Nocardiopsis sp. B62 TaxID=2824874 RepID=UPI001B3737ED|nr:hypothetical protein [Nocardiopsis sp. B62]MBQ1081578.1 hypothetical protein [Nocardiopsis sp. B62]